ncbi:hypothetical protein ES703_26958 [subsurface metagenome]
MYLLATPTPVVNLFFPVIMYLSPSRLATVSVPAASLPTKGSVIQTAPISPFAILDRNLLFCSSVPNSIVCRSPPSMVFMNTPCPKPGIRQISSEAIQAPVASSPIPPYSLEIPAPKYPLSLIFFTISQGNSLFHRASSALHIIPSTNSSTSSPSLRCSSVHHGNDSIFSSLKSIVLHPE